MLPIGLSLAAIAFSVLSLGFSSVCIVLLLKRGSEHPDVAELRAETSGIRDQIRTLEMSATDSHDKLQLWMKRDAARFAREKKDEQTVEETGAAAGAFPSKAELRQRARARGFNV